MHYNATGEESNKQNKNKQLDCRSSSPFALSSAHLILDGLLVDGFGGVTNNARLLLVPQPLAVLDVTLDIRVRRRLAVRVDNVSCADQLRGRARST